MRRYYYGSPVYYDLYTQDQLKKTYGADEGTVDVEKLSKWAFKIPGTLVHEKDIARTTWIVSTPFYYVQHTNDVLYLLRDRALEIVRRSQPQQRTVSFVRMSSS